MRYFIRFSYIGTDFHGSQVQPNGITVQEVMQQAMTTILRMPIELVFAGRTDAGVHAKQMWAHFDIPDSGDISSRSFMPLPQWVARLNSLLPHSIGVGAICPVQNGAHARFDAVARMYEYHLITRKDPFLYGRAARVATGLDFAAMNEAAKLLIGRHDFASFCKVHTDVKTTFCTVRQAQWTEISPTEAIFTIEADRFLRNMVRAVVGTLFDVGRGKMTIRQFADVVAARNRSAAGQSAPAEGLYLTRVTYPQTLFVQP